MPNQLNYPEPLTSTDFQRPSRLKLQDQNLLGTDQQQIIFGTTTRDVVELWVYNPDGTFASHMNLGYADSALSIATVVDQAGPVEVLSIDLKDVGNRMEIQPGRYAMVANFFRDEVGSETGAKLYISEISPSRTELKLTPIATDADITKALFEFVVPSVPILFAKGLVDEIFWHAITSDSSKLLLPDKIVAELDILIAGTSQKISDAGLAGVFLNIVTNIIFRSYLRVIYYLGSTANNIQIQYVELEQYVQKALQDVIYSMMQSGEIDSRFQLV